MDWKPGFFGLGEIAGCICEKTGFLGMLRVGGDVCSNEITEQPQNLAIIGVAPRGMF